MNDRSKSSEVKKAPKTAGEGGLGSAYKVLRVLLAFSSDEPKQTADAIARKVGLPLSSTYRYLGILRKAGFIDDGGSDTFKVAPTVISLARAAYGAIDLTEIAKSHMEQLCAESGETVILVRRSGDRAVCIARVESTRPVRLSFDVGTALPLHHGAAPKLLLANLPDPDQKEMIADAMAREPEFAAHVRALHTELAAIRTQGWSESVAEITPDVYAVAAPVMNRNKVIAALSIVAPAYRIPEASYVLLREMAQRAARKLSDAYDAVQI